MKRLIILLPLCFLFLGANAQAPPSNMDDFDGCGMNGSATTARLKSLTYKLLANDSIEQVMHGPLALKEIHLGSPYTFQLQIVPIQEKVFRGP